MLLTAGHKAWRINILDLLLWGIDIPDLLWNRVVVIEHASHVL